MRGAATEKAWLPTVESLTEGTTRRLVPAERSVRIVSRHISSTTYYRRNILSTCSFTNWNRQQN